MKMKAAKRLGCFLATAIIMGSSLNTYAGAYGSPDPVENAECMVSEEICTAAANTGMYEEQARDYLKTTEEKANDAIDGYEKVSAIVDSAIRNVEAAEAELVLEGDTPDDIVGKLAAIDDSNASLEGNFSESLANITVDTSNIDIAKEALSNAIETYNLGVNANNGKVGELEEYALSLNTRLSDLQYALEQAYTEYNEAMKLAEETKKLADEAEALSKSAYEQASQAGSSAAEEALIVETAVTELDARIEEGDKNASDITVEISKADVLNAIDGLTADEAIEILEELAEKSSEIEAGCEEDYLKHLNDLEMYEWATSHSETSDYAKAILKVSAGISSSAQGIIAGFIFGRPSGNIEIDTEALERVTYAGVVEDLIEREYIDWIGEGLVLYDNKLAELLGGPNVTNVISNSKENSGLLLEESQLTVITIDTEISKLRAQLTAEDAKDAYEEISEAKLESDTKYLELVSAKLKLDNVEKELSDAKTALEKLEFAKKQLAGENEQLSASIEKKQAEIKEAEAEAERLRTEYEAALNAAAAAQRRAEELEREQAEAAVPEPEPEPAPAPQKPAVKPIAPIVEEEISEEIEEIEEEEIIEEEVPLTENPDELLISEDDAPLANFKEEKFGWQWVVGVVFLGTLAAEVYRRFIVRKHASAMETFFYEDK